MGFSIGHEMTHAFDNDGIQFDSQGIKVIDWLSESSMTQYNNKADCLVQQHSGLVEPMTGVKVNGILTLTDNIADIGGVNLAYRALMEHLDQCPTTDHHSIPPFLANYTQEQLYFIAYATVSVSSLLLLLYSRFRFTF